jgi:hypothetical protein
MVHAIVNKTLYSLLLEQLRALSHIGFPRATPQLIERLESFMESRRSGSVAQGAEYDPALVKDVLSVKTLLCATLSLRVNLFTPAVGGLPLKRAGSFGGADYTNEFGPDYYSLEAKKHRRAKRRRLCDVPGAEVVDAPGVIAGGSDAVSNAAADAIPVPDPQQLLNKLANIIKQVKNS